MDLYVLLYFEDVIKKASNWVVIEVCGDGWRTLKGFHGLSLAQFSVEQSKNRANHLDKMVIIGVYSDKMRTQWRKADRDI